MAYDNVNKFRKKEYDDWRKEQALLLNTEHQLKGEARVIKKNLQATQRAVYRNNEWLRKQA